MPYTVSCELLILISDAIEAILIGCFKPAAPSKISAILCGFRFFHLAQIQIVRNNLRRIKALRHAMTEHLMSVLLRLHDNVNE
ncbi:hypothetical protein UGYR_05605 [Yersinia ruckeri]|nr:hypothetical protein UGYR_05605 [Yersinia ruckeri]